ncbi:MAG: PIN domain-containing protein [Bacteroidota bacterium]|nr:PIN domain-containing protein [Bacteroidota bacterium]
MRRIVVDTNVAFSTFLNINSRIGQILLNGAKYYDFFAPEYIRYELIGHKERIKNIGKLSEDRFVELYGLILQNVRTINHLIIPNSFYQSAMETCQEIDIDDTPFVAINDYLRGKLWTGDIRLINGLITKGYSRIVTTNELYTDFLQKENKK